MKCPNCGHDSAPTISSAGDRYRKAIEERLEDYGFSAYMNPPKGHAAAAVRKIIQFRFGVMTRAGGSMSEEMADRGIAALDEVLPRKATP